jgi:hypothetical protein
MGKSSSVFEVGGEVVGHLGDPGSDGVGGDAKQLHPSPVNLDLKGCHAGIHR